MDRLLTLWEAMGEHERKVFLTIGNRLLAGQRKYGKLEPGKKVWTWEAFEEAADLSVYLAAGLMDATAEASRRYQASLNPDD